MAAPRLILASTSPRRRALLAAAGVEFELGDDEIDAYIRTGEPMDKAGAYGIQAEGAGLVVELEGEHDNVMGLPVGEVLAALRRHTSVSREGEC